MEYRFSYQQKAFQKLGLTPQMRHSIKLLSMSTKDLHEYVDAAIGANPFLKKAFEEKKDKYKSHSPRSDNNSLTYEYVDYMNQQNEDPRSSFLSQLRMLNLDGKSLEIAEWLIYEMDDNGYIAVSLDEVANDSFATLEEVEECLEAIQSLEPAGIGARDVRECLQLQLKKMGKENSLEYLIVSDYINELAVNDIKKLSKAFNVDEEGIRIAVDNIKKLNPRPASSLLSEKPEWVTPDLIANVEGKKIHLRLNREWLPSLKLYNPYEENAEIVEDPQAKEFMKENINSAKDLIENLKRREETMCKVADFILNFHRYELINGMDEIKSLTAKDISKALNLHPSTVNRTVSNKYIEINGKVMPLKYFLSHGIKKENGEIASKTTIKKKIEAIVKNEDKRRPLTDRAIQEKLAQEGIVIKRRTIAKYRNALRILPSYLRKKLA